MDVSIIIPAYNEAESVGEIVVGIKNTPETANCEVIVVDDGSSDETAARARAAGAKVVSHPYNLGNGASVKSGVMAASGDVLVMMDADGQHPPEHIPRLLEHMDRYHMVVGARTKVSDVSRFRTVGNRVLIAVAQYLVGRKIDDLTSGFRAVRKETFEEFAHLFPQRYSYPTTITLACFSSGHFVKYVPLDAIRRRSVGKSNIRPFRDGLRFLHIILRMILLFSPMKFFIPISFFFLACGLALGGYGAIVHSRLEESALLMLLLGFFLQFFGILADQSASIRREMRTLLMRKSSRNNHD